ncbi:MAG: GAF domain-containing sensor histidine kinase [Deltaproteobacteria bacterium]|nr:GAF domain-containing sensor histidine kinase [Deltaproteobacteria bacterium]
MLVFGGLVLCGWLFRVPALIRPHPALVVMKANAALGFVLLGMVVWLLADPWAPIDSWRARAARALSLVAAMIGLATFVEYALGLDLRIDEVLAIDRWAPRQTGAAGRMALNSAACLFLSGVAAFVIWTPLRRRYWISQALAALVWFAALVTLVGYAYQVEVLYRVGAVTSMAQLAAALFLVTSIATLGSRPDEGFVGALTRGGPGSYMFRRQLPPIIFLPLVLGWIRLWGEEQGFYPTRVGTLILALSLVFVFVLMAWQSAVSMNRADEKRRRAERAHALLAEAGKVVGASLNLDETLQRVTNAAVPAFADWCLIHVVNEHDVAVLRAFAASRESERELLRDLAAEPGETNPRSAIREAIRSGRPLLVREVTPEHLQHVLGHPALGRILDQLSPRSLVLAPIFVEGTATAAMMFGMGASGRCFDDGDVAIAEELASRAAIAIHNASLFRKTNEAVRERDETLAVISHDLRNPLGAILLSANLLKRAAGDVRQQELVRARVDVILRSGERMNNMIEDLLSVSKLDAGRLGLNPLTVCGPEVVDAAVETMRPWALKKNVSLVVDIRTSDFRIECDQDRLERVLTNLLGNAIKFSPTGAVVIVGVEDEGVEELLFSVSDRGPGIPAEDQGHVFERFWQAPETAQSGTGLGLAIAKGIVEAHGGRIWVESEVGRGATFRFTVPKPARRSHAA